MSRPQRFTCTMCGLEFVAYRAKATTCSPRCRKRRERVLKGTALATWKMEQPPNPTASKLWR